jgi:hypothetical protein
VSPLNPACLFPPRLVQDGILLRLADDLLVHVGRCVQEESALLYGLSYNSPYKTPHNKRILDEEERRNTSSGAY